MSPKEIFAQCSGLKVDEQREVSDNYVEIVFLNTELAQWNKILSDVLGPALKPLGVESSEEALELTKDYGGIYDNQTLFKKDFADVTVAAMFWPWQDAQHTTLKIFLVNK
ncbi:MAG: hypothetical protein JW714_05625 [Candidatus Omnitrophica bacterium]|nr:hypothetical protein [Candidatus Omnitrophota bacterium]